LTAGSRRAIALLIAVAGLAALVFSMARARQTRLSAPPPTITLPWSRPEPHGESFFVGAWCSPPTSTTNPEVWRRFARAGVGVAVRPLEDTNDRGKNLATLALLDTLRSGDISVRTFVRDGAVHPDEATRPGWRERVRAVTAAYKGHPSLAGYFLADEPSPADFDRVAQVAAAFREFDDFHPAYVNLLPLRDQATVAEQERWRADAARLIRNGRLQMFSFDAYSQRPFGEDASFLLTLQNAQRVARETGCPFATVLQFTGFGPLAPLNAAQMNYVAAEAVAHGAIGIIWFTYWTPNPREAGMRWNGGAVAYDGTPGARADTLRLVSDRARALAHDFPPGPHSVAHFGGAWPRGALLTNQRIAGLTGATGGPLTIAAVASGPSGGPTWLLINRDRVDGRTFTLAFDPTVGARSLRAPLQADADRQRYDPAERSIEISLGPGEASTLELVAR
jgi:hypothetical protein